VSSDDPNTPLFSQKFRIRGGVGGTREALQKQQPKEKVKLEEGYVFLDRLTF
jgi:hypothetical protein